MNYLLRRKSFGSFLIVGGFLLIIFGFSYRSVSKLIYYSLINKSGGNGIVLGNFHRTENYEAEDIPSRVVVERVKIDLEVKEAKVINGEWEVFANFAGWGVGSGIPGRAGNVVVFAHARIGLFYPLKDVRVGDEVSIFTKNNNYKYKIFDIKSVTPQDLSVIDKSENEILTLYTCSGYADLKRLIVVAKRV